MHTCTLLNHWMVSGRYHDISPYNFQLVSPKDILLHNHRAIITPKKFNIDTIWSKIQSIFQFPQLSQTAFDGILGPVMYRGSCTAFDYHDSWVFYIIIEHSNTLQKLSTSHNMCLTAISTYLTSLRWEVNKILKKVNPPELFITHTLLINHILLNTVMNRGSLGGRTNPKFVKGGIWALLSCRSGPRANSSLNPQIL